MSDSKSNGAYLSAIDLRRQMEVELEQMYNLMGAQTRYSVDRLRTINPNLFTQIEKSALEKLDQKLKDERLSSSSSITGGTIAGTGLGTNASSTVHNKYDTSAGQLDENSREKFKNRMIGGFISEQPIVFDLGVAYDLTMKLREWSDPNKPSPENTVIAKVASGHASARLGHYLKNLDAPPPLPSLIAGLLSLSLSLSLTHTHTH
jgi:hypothetical protein